MTCGVSDQRNGGSCPDLETCVLKQDIVASSFRCKAASHMPCVMHVK